MIHGSQVTLRPATEDDRWDVYSWLTASDVTPLMMGPPTFTDVAIPSWDEFCADYVQYFFDGTRPDRGRSFIITVGSGSVGHISYSELDSKHRTAELDIWMRSQQVCGQGYGTDALLTVMRYLRETCSASKCIVRPSLRNQRAVCAYQKAGLKLSELPLEKLTQIYGHGEYSDTVTLERQISA
ncbi:GNAT family N-acetyltransferase [Acaryochloris marina NIES-2412]|uniref:GNAT family N-acetyltransferase n=1 Tax=Acaryochloris marina TaxID=155978 RepID=UPI00405A37CE